MRFQFGSSKRPSERRTTRNTTWDMQYITVLVSIRVSITIEPSDHNHSCAGKLLESRKHQLFSRLGSIQFTSAFFFGTAGMSLRRADTGGRRCRRSSMSRCSIQWIMPRTGNETDVEPGWTADQWHVTFGSFWCIRSMQSFGRQRWTDEFMRGIFLSERKTSALA